MADFRLPTLDEVEACDLDVVSMSFKSDEELRFRVLEPHAYPEYRPFDLVFRRPKSFSGADDLWGVHFCRRGRAASGDGLVFEFETRELVPTEGRPYQVQVSDESEPRVLFGRTVREIKARIVAEEVTLEDAST
jgi:hypothetical protein